MVVVLPSLMPKGMSYGTSQLGLQKPDENGRYRVQLTTGDDRDFHALVELAKQDHRTLSQEVFFLAHKAKRRKASGA